MPRGSVLDTVLRLLGPEAEGALRDPLVSELYTVEGDGRLWLDSAVEGRHRSRIAMPANRVEMLLNSIATATSQELGADSPLLAAELPDHLGRLQGFLPPVVSEPIFVLRKPAPRVFKLDSLVTSGFLPSGVAERLREALAERRTVLLLGGTSTGKTTFLNSLLLELAQLCPEDRVAVLEDTPELICSSADQIRLRTAPGIDLYRLLDSVLRASPRRIVVGEVRDQAALAMLDAWNTGHPGGLATLHANSCASALLRLSTLVQRANVPPQNPLIAATVSLLVRLEGTTVQTRRVAEVAQLHGYDPAADRWDLEPIYDGRRSS